jgi:peptidoglycan/LPS O-acetylase OafA/YrhL
MWGNPSDAGARNARIDLMRGISIVLVLLHHFNIAYRLNDTMLADLFGWPLVHAVVRNGNYAVTMFFVISGFLITANTDTRWGGLHNIRASTFYRYRAARIVPCVLLLLLIVNLLAALRIDIFENHPEFGGPVSFWIVNLASLTFWMNVLMRHAGWLNYVLCVQWSLSIEEVFYLSFPVLCLLLRRDRLLLIAWSVFIVIGPIWRATHQASEYDELNAYLSCFDGIAFGCCAAVLGKRLRLPAGARQLLQGLVAIGMIWFYLGRPIGDTAVYGVSLMAFGTAVLLIAQSQVRLPLTGPAAIFDPLRRCGRLSYELYLFHLIVLGLLQTVWKADATVGNSKVALLAVYLVFSIAVSVLVGRYYSDPLNRRLRARPLGLFPPVTPSRQAG